jgi:predicted DNA-binding protein with PD1-like motif
MHPNQLHPRKATNRSRSWSASRRSSGSPPGVSAQSAPFSSAVLGYFDRERKEYVEIEVDEQVEVLTLLGDVAAAEAEPKIHAHVVLGKRSAVVGGHLLRAQVRLTLELMLRESAAKLRKRHDQRPGSR